MSSRFGRNQKRQLKQQIKDLEYRCALAEGLQHKLGNDLRELKSFVREWDERISEMLHKDSAYLSSPNCYTNRGEYGSSMNVYIPPKKSTSYFHGSDNVKYTVSCMMETLYKLEVAVDSDYNTQAKHITMKVGNRRAAYYISDSTLASYGLSTEQLQYVGQDIAARLHECIKPQRSSK